MQGHDGGAGRGGLAESDSDDGASTAEDGNSALAAASEASDAIGDVCAAGDFHDVATESVGAVAGDEDGGVGFVLGAGWAAAGAARAGFDDGTFVVVDVFTVFVVVVVGGWDAGGVVGVFERHVLGCVSGAGAGWLAAGKA